MGSVSTRVSTGWYEGLQAVLGVAGQEPKQHPVRNFSVEHS